MDPRVKTSPEDLRRQFDLDRKIAEALHRDYEPCSKCAGLRAQLKALAEHAAGHDHEGSKLSSKQKPRRSKAKKAATVPAT